MNSIKSALLVTALAAILFLTIAAVMKTSPRQEFLEKRAALVVRDVGHRLLLQAGDSTSRVLPVKQLGSGIFQLEFENRFAFMPDSLVKIVSRNLAVSDLPLNYMVNVFDCADHDMVYGFEIRYGKADVIPCRGRMQPGGCYFIQVAFFDLTDSDASFNVYHLSILALAGITFFTLIGAWTFRKTRVPAVQVNESSEYVMIGPYKFNLDKKTLSTGMETIALSDKESKLLGILAASPNELIDRNHLLKEVWENEGVITGRSLDVFVSRLRKKLGQGGIRITNVHGRGYKLEVE